MANDVARNLIFKYYNFHVADDVEEYINFKINLPRWQVTWRWGGNGPPGGPIGRRPDPCWTGPYGGEMGHAGPSWPNISQPKKGWGPSQVRSRQESNPGTEDGCAHADRWDKLSAWVFLWNKYIYLTVKWYNNGMIFNWY